MCVRERDVVVGKVPLPTSKSRPRLREAVDMCAGTLRRRNVRKEVRIRRGRERES